MGPYLFRITGYDFQDKILGYTAESLKIITPFDTNGYVQLGKLTAWTKKLSLRAEAFR